MRGIMGVETTELINTPLKKLQVLSDYLHVAFPNQPIKQQLL
jgi:hypothetical protein